MMRENAFVGKAVAVMQSAEAPIVPAIFCDGSGVRLWPVSRKNFARQHASVLGGVSPLRRTLQRVARNPVFPTPLVLTSVGGRFLAADPAAAVGVSIDLAVEPEGRDTLAAIVAIAEILARRDPDTMAPVPPPDHPIPDAAATGGGLVTSGLTPSNPSTAFGHIQPGAATPGGARRVARFVEADLVWSDIGDWRELRRLADKDAHDNATEGAAVVADGRGDHGRSEGRPVCALGVQDLVVLDTPGVVLVTRRDRTRDVKILVSDLMERGRSEATTPARVCRPWGRRQTMDLGDRFRLKRIQAPPGKKFSLQNHHHRAGHWVVAPGTAGVICDGVISTVRENESIHLPLGCVHRLATRARSRSRSSRCEPAPISGRTTSYASRTISAEA